MKKLLSKMELNTKLLSNTLKTDLDKIIGISHKEQIFLEEETTTQVWKGTLNVITVLKLLSSALIEQKAYKRLGIHPNIAELIYFRHEDKLAILFPDYIPLLAGLNGEISEDKICEQLLIALVHMHTCCAIIHKDIKLANIAVEKSFGDLKVFDFDCCEMDGIVN